VARYSIMVRQRGASETIEYIKCDSNPEAIVKGLQKKMRTIHRSIFEAGSRRYQEPMYDIIEIVDHGDR